MSIGLIASALNVSLKYTGTKMQLAAIKRALERDQEIVLRFNALDNEKLDRAINRFYGWTIDNGFIVKTARYTKATVSYTVKDMQWNKQQMEVDLTLDDKHWITAWKEHIKDNMPYGYTLWNSRSCALLGCPMLVAIWMRFEVSRK